MKRCPPGVICVENVTMFLLFIILGILGFFIYSNTKQHIIVNDRNNITIKNSQETPPNNGISWPYTNLPKDVLLNPYDAPYKDDRYFVPELTRATPINISTNLGAVSTETPYRQMGIMTPLNGASKDNIIPLMGRPLFTNRDKWQYYTISNQHNNVKLPISFKGKSALNDYGVDQIFSGDTVYVEGYNDSFKTTVYENDTIKYLPFL